MALLAGAGERRLPRLVWPPRFPGAMTPRSDTPVGGRKGRTLLETSDDVAVAPRRKAIGDIREVRSLLQQPDEKGAIPTVRFPDWYKRTGTRSAEIDSGFGTVRVRAVYLEDDLKGDELLKVLLGALRELPDWTFEENAMIGGKSFAKGDAVPMPLSVNATRNAQHARAYVEAALPPSLLQQVYLAIGFMAVPPIDITSADPS